MTNTFTGKVGLVTGATSGIGRATAIAFAEAGAKVVIAGRREEEGAQVVREIEKVGGEVLFVRTDVSRESDVEALVAKTLERFGRLDCAFNNAGVFLDAGPVTETTNDVFDRTININVRGVLYGMKHQIPAILKSGGGQRERRVRERRMPGRNRDRYQCCNACGRAGACCLARDASDRSFRQAQGNSRSRAFPLLTWCGLHHGDPHADGWRLDRSINPPFQAPSSNPNLIHPALIKACKQKQ